MSIVGAQVEAAGAGIARDGIERDEVWAVVEGVWESLIGTAVAPAEHAFGLDDAVTASVAMHGEWAGLVTFTCPSATARRVAQVMLDLGPAEDVQAADVVDAVGELVNVVGGNVKALAFTEASLGLPTVGPAVTPLSAVPLCRLGLEWRDAGDGLAHVARVAVWRVAGTVEGSEEGTRG